MLRFFITILIFVTVVYGRPFGCSEDNQCSYGYFCDLVTHFCRECFHCYELGRNMPEIFKIDCVRSGADCGGCHDGLVYYNGDINAKCVQAGKLKYTTIQLYVCSTGILVGLLIIIIFIQVLRSTDVFQIITYSSLMSISSTN